MKYQVLYNTYTNSSMLEAFRNRQEFINIDAKNKPDAVNKIRTI